MKIERVDNGYIVSEFDLIGGREVYRTLDEVLNEILSCFEGLCPEFQGARLREAEKRADTIRQAAKERAIGRARVNAFLDEKHADTAREPESFGAYLHRLRVERRLPLRLFAIWVGLRPADYSELERDLAQSPEAALVERIAGVLRLPPESEEWATLFRLAGEK